MTDNRTLGLPVVDATELPAPLRAALRPGEPVRDARGLARRLPRFFYEVADWATAKETELAPGFRLHELIATDVREAAVLHHWPRYVPCAVFLLAPHLSIFRNRVGTFVHIAANGGYRSPAHRGSRDASPHCWGTAANVYKIGDELLDDQEKIERYAEVARQALPHLWVRPWGHTAGTADDHLHLDLGYCTVVPREAGDEAPAEEVA